uniref:NADH-ubiquinone oxidoreductase chain 4 n=1 Tax=Echinochasmus japonicus TaxID=1197313 RepID=A0A186QE92_9TREM|nr:NADH dehydrogenase subunit 4 [Echinochasmus japonicus]AKL39059.1 NADH dehydrogenase subunit 4 [Echinochasmus japonicus]
MGFQKFDSFSGGLGFLFVFILGFVLSCISFLGVWLVGSVYCVESGIFVLDSVGFYLSLLSFFLGVSLLYGLGGLSFISKVMLLVSVFFSVLCYCCIHALWFWVFYEMSILPLLFLLIVESPYSERFIASWYLLGYVVLTSLPMLLCIFYGAALSGGYYLQSWSSLISGGCGFMVFLLLSFMFITKIPLPPFHVWLPIVHAEASSPVSMCLSGYIMKLGLLGVCRFSFYILSDYVFSFWYVVLCLGFSVLFFMSASRELDGKRWLAFLSLSHISISSLCLCVSSYDVASVSFLYCLGHGLSAGVTFLLLWLVYEVSGSRNWEILKYCLSSSLLLRVLSVSCMCTVASIPPMVQFFSEVLILCEGGYVSVVVGVLMFLYLFMSGLIPMFLVGSLLSRHYSISFGVGSVVSMSCGVVFLVVWCYILFLVF